MAVVTQAIARFDDDQVESQGQAWHRRTVRERSALEEPVRSGPDSTALPSVHRLLGQTECSVGPPTHLQGHQHAGRAGVDRDQVELVPANVHVPTEDRPASGDKPLGNELLGGVSQPLGVGTHRATVAAANRR